MAEYKVKSDSACNFIISPGHKMERPFSRLYVRFSQFLVTFISKKRWKGSVLRPEKLKISSRSGFENFCSVSIWNEWSSWGECKGQCGRGFRQRE